MAQQLKDEVRERMLAAAETVFAESGYRGATMAAIAREAGISTGNLYRYFGGKEDLFYRVFTDEFAARFLELLSRRVGSLADSPDLLDLDAGAERDGEELLGFWIAHRAKVVVLLGRAEGSRYEGFADQFVDALMRPTLAALRQRAGRETLPNVVTFTLRNIFENTVRTIVSILDEHHDDDAIREAFEAFWRYQLAGLAGLLTWVGIVTDEPLPEGEKSMRVLFIGGTGNISASCCRLCVERGMEVYALNRGQRDIAVPGVKPLVADINDSAQVRAALGDLTFDAVANFIAFVPADIERDIALFAERTGQYLFISSASAYQKPLVHPVVTESTPLKNPFWQYSRDKIACEDALVRAYRERDFPMVIVRPSLTYDTVWPIAIGGWNDFTLIDRIRRGGEMIVHGDGTSLWTVTHAEDFAVGFCGLIGNGNAIGHAFHITSDELLTWDRLYTTIAEAAGVEPKLVHIPSEFLARIDQRKRGSLLGDKAHSPIFDNTKIKRFVPEFVAKTPFHIGVRKTLAWFEADPNRQRIVDAINETMDGYIAAWRSAAGTSAARSRGGEP